MLFKSVVSSLVAATAMLAAPASASLIGNAVTIKRIQNGTVVFKSVSTTVGDAIEFNDNFFNIDITENEIVFDAISPFSIGDIFYTIEGLDFDNLPATPNVITAFTSTQIFGSAANPFDATRATIASDGTFSLTFRQTTGSGSGIARITLGAPTAAVPEPAAWAMMIGGFALAGAASRRRHKPAVAHA